MIIRRISIALSVFTVLLCAVPAAHAVAREATPDPVYPASLMAMVEQAAVLEDGAHFIATLRMAVIVAPQAERLILAHGRRLNPGAVAVWRGGEDSGRSRPSGLWPWASPLPSPYRQHARPVGHRPRRKMSPD